MVRYKISKVGILFSLLCFFNRKFYFLVWIFVTRKNKWEITVFCFFVALLYLFSLGSSEDEVGFVFGFGDIDMEGVYVFDVL